MRDVVEAVEHDYNEKLSALERVRAPEPDEDTKVLVGVAVGAVGASFCFACLSVGVAALAYVLGGRRG